MLRRLALVVVTYALAAPARACSCAPEPSRGLAIRSSELVFVGTALSFGPTDVYPAPGLPLYAVTFDVEELIGGWAARPSVPLQRDTVQLTLEQGQGDDCGFPFEPGKQYLVYANRIDFGLFGASICGRTALAADAEGEIAALRDDVASGSVGYRPPRYRTGGSYVDEGAFDSLATYAAKSETRGRKRLGWSLGLNVILAFCFGWAAARALRRRTETG